jgi:hypothetical protein
MLVVYASELAAAIGLNKYRPVAEVATQVFARMDKHLYEAALKR